VRYFSITALEIPIWLERGWRVRYTWPTDRRGLGACVEGQDFLDVPPVPG
jgi:hypothetical protein